MANTPKNNSEASSTTDSASGKSRLTRRGYRGLSAEQLQEQRQQRIIDAGIELFGERGYAATSIERLCSQARVSTRHFYEQFKGREATLHAIHDAIVGQMQLLIRSELIESDSPMNQRVADTIEAIMLFLLDDPRRGRILCLESVGVSAAMEAKRREANHRLADIINRYAHFMAEHQVLPERDYHLPSVALVGMFNELVVEWLTGDTGLSPKEMSREAKILFRAMVFGAQHYQDSESMADLDEASMPPET